MKVLMIVRSNFFGLGGGDKVQVIKTKEALEKLGHQVDITTSFPAKMRSYDVIHLFNMMIAPHAFLLYCLYAHADGVPVALSTIYWNPNEWLEHAAAEGFPGPTKEGVRRSPFDGIPAWRVAWAILRFPVARHWFWLFLKTHGSGEASAHIRRSLLKKADIILPNGQSEAELVQKDFGKAKKVRVVPNGVDDEFADANKDGFVKQYGQENFVLHVGRIETRKNLLPLVKAAKELGLPLVMIGNDQYDKEYTEAVKAAAAPDTLFIPEMPHDELGSAYQAAKVHALASWFETPGLSSLEAGLAGCNVVSTDRGTTREYFKDLAWYCDPADPASIKSALSAAFAAKREGRLRQQILQNYTWDKAAQITEQAYLEIVGSR